MPSSRFEAATSLFLNGTKYGVLMFGGAPISVTLNAPALADTWQFDPGTHTWWNVTGALNCDVANPCPTGRFGASMSYDYGDGYTLLYGGCTNATNASEAGYLCPGRLLGSPGRLSDTWEYLDPQGGVGRWVRTGYGTAPSARYGAGMAYDWVDGYVLLYGGCSVRCPVSDTWAFANGLWFHPFPLPAPPGPPALYDMGMAALGTSQGVILFGGCRQAGAGCGGPGHLMGDTWQFAAGSWAQLRGPTNCTSSEPCPSGRYLLGATAYDGPGLAPSVLIYGGLGPGGTVLGNSTEPGGGWWSFSGPPFRWVQLSGPPGYTSPTLGWTGTAPGGHLVGTGGAGSPPAPRYGEALVGTPYGGLVLFGGVSAAGTNLTDLWGAESADSPPAFLPYSGLIAPLQTPPPAYGANLVYDAADDYAVLFGGCAAVCPTSTTWTYAPYSLAVRPQPWTPVEPPAGTGVPSARQGASMVFAPLGGGVVLLFGGKNRSGSFLQDLWQFREGVWSPVAVLGAPPLPRAYAALAYDAVANQVVLFGGQGATGPLGDTWLLSYLPFASAWTWIEDSQKAAPAPRYGSAAAYDDATGQVVLFGGCASSCSFADTWLFDGSRWSQCRTVFCLTAGPSARTGAAMQYDPGLASVILLGGCGRGGCPLSDLWSFDPSSGGIWVQLPFDPALPAREQAALTFDPRLGGLLDWGGLAPGGAIMGGVGALFTGSWHVDESAPRVAAVNTEPMPMFGAEMVYDSARQVVVLFGGCPATTLNPACSLGGSLGLFASSWTYANGSWLLACTACAPAPRWGAAMAFDGVDNYTVLFGGCPTATGLNGVCNAPLNDTWIFSNRTTGWTRRVLTVAPSPRADAAFGWDERDGVDVLYGGWNGNVSSANSSLNDTWGFVSGTWTKCGLPSMLPPFPVCSIPPQSPLPGGSGGLFGASMAEDPVTGVLYLYGGMGTLGSERPSNALWTYSAFVGWSLIARSPVGVYDAATVFDPHLGNVIVVGGLDGQGRPFGGTQMFLGYLPTTGNTWTVVANPVGLGARSGGAAVYDPWAGPDGADLWFGGVFGGGLAVSPGGTGVAQGDVWEFLQGAQTWYDITAFT